MRVLLLLTKGDGHGLEALALVLGVWGRVDVPTLRPEAMDMASYKRYHKLVIFTWEVVLGQLANRAPISHHKL